MNKLHRGLYETLVDEALQDRLKHLDDTLSADCGPVHPSEAPDRFALHIRRIFQQALSSVGDAQRVTTGVQLTQEIIRLLEATPHTGVDMGDQLLSDGLLLKALLAFLPNGAKEHIQLPATPLLDTTLLTNAPGEPRIGYQLQSEIPSADSIDILMAFVRRSGIQPLAQPLRKHCAAGRSLRLLTTIYTGSTELAALEQLQSLGADIRISYDTSSTRLHAKAWLFHRASGYSTAYIGSSNLTHDAQVTGIEWNVRVSGARNPDVIDKFGAVFESHWQSEEFRPFDHREFREQSRAATRHSHLSLSPVELRAMPFQARLLERIELARHQGHHRNLLVSATGTGKTVMAALDYQRLRSKLPRARLLFVAHRREILDQSLATFRIALRDAAFGELWVATQHPEQFEHVFASIQSLASTKLGHLAHDHFDVVIVDEFHHAAARTYDALLKHLHPRELLSLTATPERADGQSILGWFDGRIAAELRVWDAIEQQRLCPFAYYGISDGLDLRGLDWKRGRGYEVCDLDKIVTGNHVHARLIIQQVLSHLLDLAHMKALGFCASINHAKFMAEQFNRFGIEAVAVTGTTLAQERAEALRALETGTLKIVFAVDLFNEGVDLPTVNTLLLLRPTDSATIFLQQLGRGLRKWPGKSVCTVLDFVSLHRAEFRFQNRLGALLGGTRKRLIEQVESGFPWLPSGCHMELDAVAAKNVLDNLRSSLPSTKSAKARELQRITQATGRPTLMQFLDESDLALDDIYTSSYGWSDLLEAAGVRVPPAGPDEASLRRAIGRLLHVDDEARIRFYARLAESKHPIVTTDLPAGEQRLFHMLAASLLTGQATQGLESLQDAANRIWQHPQVLAELGELMELLGGRIDHISVPLEAPAGTPLFTHARYTRREILAALAGGDRLALADWREGTRWLPEYRTDLALITLDKSSGHFSPTTRYRDYAVSRSLIHWESQSATRADSKTGQRYQAQSTAGTHFLMFARLTSDDRAFWCLGPASYLSHEGERPMAITWRLAH